MRQAANNLLDTIANLLATAQFHEVVEACKPELVMARNEGDAVLESIALYGLSAAHLYLGKFEEARILNNGAVEYARKAGDDEALALALNLSGDIHMTSTYQTYEANEEYRSALLLAHELDSPLAVTQSLIGIANFLLSIGETERAQRYAREAFEIAREHNYQPLMVTALSTIGNTFHMQNNHEKALKTFRDALVMSEEHGFVLNQVLLIGNVGLLYISSARHHAEGMSMLEDALRRSQEIHCVPHEFISLYRLGLAQIQEGKLDAAEDYYDQMLNRAQTWKSRPYEGTAFFNLGSLYVVEHRLDDALHSYQQAMSIAQETKNPFHEARAEAAIAMVHRSAHRYDEAIAHYQAARALYVALDNEAQTRETTRSILLMYVLRIVDSMLRMVGLRQDAGASQGDDTIQHDDD